MIFVSFRSRYFVDGEVRIPFPEHCIPNINEWIVLDEMDIHDFFVSGQTVFTHWQVIAKEIVFNKADHYPNIICTVSMSTSSEKLFLSN